MGQVVSRGLPTLLTWVLLEVSLRGVCSVLCSAGKGYAANALVFPRHSYSCIALLPNYVHLQLTLCYHITESVIK
jgi:hypothetical protein